MSGLRFPEESILLISYTLSLESLWWHLTQTKRTALDKAGFWTLALEYEF